MATRFSAALFPDNTTDANFRAWAQFFEDTLVTTGGWLVSTETGDTAPASLAHPTIANSKKGFRVYKMNDSLQGTFPIFMRIDFGSGSSATIPAMWPTIGTGSDGAGTITGVMWNGGASISPDIGCASSSTTQVCNSYGSAGTARFSIAMFVQSANTALHFVFCLGRTKDSTGADTGDGLLISFKANAVTVIGGSRYLIYGGGSQPTVESALSYILTSRNPSETFGGDIGVGIVIHFKGVAQQPGTNLMIVNSSDVSAEGTVILTLYGASRTYQHLNTLTPSKAISGSSTTDGNARVMIRYD